MFGSPKMFCQFHAHKGPKKVSKDTCGHFQCVFVPWTCEFVPQKKFSNQHLSGKKFSTSCLNLHRCFASSMPTKGPKKVSNDTSGQFQCVSEPWTCQFVPQKKFSNQNLSGQKVFCLMFGSPMMFCKFHAHKGPKEVLKDTCGHFQCVSVPWTCQFVPQKKFSNQNLSGKKVSASCLNLQRSKKHI